MLVSSPVQAHVYVTIKLHQSCFNCHTINNIYLLAGHPRSGCPARLRGHKGSGLWKVRTVPSPALPCPASLPPSLPRAKFDQAGSSRLAEITARRSARVLCKRRPGDQRVDTKAFRHVDHRAAKNVVLKTSNYASCDSNRD